MVDELLRSAHLKVEEELRENEKINNLGLEIVVKSIMKIVANGYAINLTDKQRAFDLNIIEASAVAQKRLIEATKEIKIKFYQKLLSKNTRSLYLIITLSIV